MPVIQLRRRTTVWLLVIAAVTLAVAGIVAYGYVRNVAVVRYTAEHGRVTVNASAIGGLGTVLVTNKATRFTPSRRTGPAGSAAPATALLPGRR